MGSAMKKSVKRLRCAAGVSFALLFLVCPGLVQGPFPSACGTVWAAARDGVAVQALVEKNSVSVGEPFLMQIRVQGSDIVPGTDPPDTSGVVEFAVEYLGGQSNNSSSVTIINGKVSKVESYGYIYSYRLTPKKVGKLEIPSIAVPIDAAKSKMFQTEPVTIQVTEPEVTDDFRLELQFSKTRFYVGEPVILSVVWYIGKEVQSVNFSLPLLQDSAFALADPKLDQDPGKQYLQIPIGGANVLAEKGVGVHNGRQYTTLSFRKVLFAKKPGSFEIPEAGVSCRALIGYSRQGKTRDPFGRFFDDDFFGSGKSGVYKTFVARSQPVVLTALALPEEGKPAGFSGCVGNFRLEASASASEVSIGDPITLTVSVSGPDYLANVELPPLAKDPELDRDFKIPEEMAAGVVRGNTKQFTQTLRAKTEDVQAIAPIKLPFFNPDTGQYEVAQSQPIALKVKKAKVLTSADVEGKPEEAAVKKSELENWAHGIAYNYEGPEVLERQDYRIASIMRSPLWLAITLTPFFTFIVVLIFTKVRQKHLSNTDGLRSRKALARFKHNVHNLGAEGLRNAGGCSLLLDAMRRYLEDKLREKNSALTFSDVEGKLKGRGVNPEVAERLKHLFDACEQGSYGGLDLDGRIDELVREALVVIRALDRMI